MTRTEEIEHLVTLALEGDNVDELLSGLSPDSLDLFYTVIDEIRTGQESELVKELWRVDYTRRPPSIAEFITDDYWLGQVCRHTEENEGVYPAWREILIQDFDLESRLHNVVVTGSLGIGKCHGKGTRVQLFDGTLRDVSEVKAGDRLLGDDFTPRTVLRTFQGYDKLYQVQPEGASRVAPFTCTADHILCLTSHVGYAPGRFIEISVSDLLKNPARFAGWRLYRARQGRRPVTCQFSVSQAKTGPYFGFGLDGNHRYLLEDQVVTHNSWVGVLVIIYRLTLATLLRSPYNFLGMSTGSQIFYVILSVSKGQVEETAFGDAKNYMAHSPYFMDELGYSPNCRYSNFRVRLGRQNIYLTAGSKGQHVLGRNSIGVMLDEGNFRLEANPDVRAYQLYDQVRTRIENRFQRRAGFLPAICVLASSSSDESSFTERVIRDIQQANSPATQKVYRLSMFEARRHQYANLTGNHFKVSYGDTHSEPRILRGTYDRDGQPISATVEAPSSTAKTSLVPIEFIEAFQRNCAAALQGICGVSISSSHLLFPSMVQVHEAITRAQAVGLTNPAKFELIPLSKEDDRQLWHALDHSKFVIKRMGSYLPLRHPSSLRYAHLDLATRSMAGLTICHLAGTQLVTGLVSQGRVYSAHRSVVEPDFILTIVAGQRFPIMFEKICNFFIWLRRECGFQFGKITADSWQSEGPLQTLDYQGGFDVGVLSIDRKKDPYYALRTAIDEDRLSLFTQSMLLKELSELVDGPDKVDHPAAEGASKDTSDSLAGAVWNCLTHGTAHAESEPPFITNEPAPGESPELRGIDTRHNPAPPLSFSV